MADIRPTPDQIETFPPTYKTAYLKLLADYEDPKADKLSILQDFSRKYVLLPTFWYELRK